MRKARARRAGRASGREVIAFIERYLRIPDGPRVGQPLILAPWMKQEIRAIYDNAAGCRRHIISTAKKNSKTTLCGALLLNHLCGPSARGRRNARLYSSAQSREQAGLTFDAARRMVLLNPDLAQIIKIKESAKMLTNSELGIEFRALSSEANTAQGINPVLHIADELGEVEGPTSALFDAIELGAAAQPDPLSVVISTQAASDGALLSTLVDDALAGYDPRTTVSLYTARKDCALDDESAIRTANPSYDLFMNKEEILAAARAAMRMPSRESAFRRYTLNQRVIHANPFVSQAVWDACYGAVAPLDELQPIYAGLDLSSAVDLSALILVGQRGNRWHVHCRFWLPEEGLAEKSRAEHTPYDVWARQGHLQTTPGKTIDLDFVAAEICDLLRHNNIVRVAYDPWNFDYLKPSLRRAGVSESLIAERFVAFPQTTKMMSPALQNLERLLIDQRIVHDNPCLSMNAAHAMVRMDSGGNRALDKKRATHKIDGMVALAMGLGQVPAAPPPVDVTALIG
jgi:phage terminase large subunit-like protein